MMQFSDNDIDNYIVKHSSPLNDILDELERATYQQTTRPRMLSGKVQGAILRSITRVIKPKRVVEIGTFTGYSAISMAAAMEQGSELHTIDVDDETAFIAEEFFAMSGYNDIIKQHIGSALDIVPCLGGVFDMVFIDGNKREYIEYYNMLMDGGYLKKGSVILADNVLWDGKILDINARDSQTVTLKEFNRMVAEDGRVEVSILPLRDGLSVINIL